MVLMMIAPLSDLKCFLTDGFPIAELRVTDQPVPIPVLMIGDEDESDASIWSDCFTLLEEGVWNGVPIYLKHFY